jgi:branched-chain amino acid transport system substrate-binding protein
VSCRITGHRPGWVVPALGAAAALVLSMVTGCASSSDDPSSSSTVKIGVLLPLSGADAALGKDALDGAQLAADLIDNGLPGLTLPLTTDHGLPNLNHAKIQLVTADTAGQPANAASTVDHLVNDEHVTALEGALESGVTQTAAQRAERLGVPMVTGISSAPSLTQQGFKWFFRVGPTDVTYAQALFGVLDQQQRKGVEASRISVLYMNNQFGTDADKVAHSLAAADGKQIVADVPFDPAATDLTAQLEQVRSAQPDSVFVIAYPSSATLIMNALHQLNYMPPSMMAFGAGFIEPTFLASEGSKLDGVSRRVAWSQDMADRNPQAKLVSDEFQRRYHAPMTENSARIFSAIMSIAIAVNNAHATEPDQVLAALTALDVPGRDTIMPWDSIKFDAQHQNTGAIAVVEQYLNGSWKVVYPADVASQSIVWPAQNARTATS